MVSQIDQSLSGQFDHLPPHSVEAEMCVLASMMLDTEKTMISEVSQIVDRDSFFQADHQIIFDILVKLHREGRAVDATILREELNKRQLLNECGGVAYIAKIIDTVPSASHGVHYAKIVQEKSALRRLIEFSNKVLRDTYAPHENASDIMSRAVSDLTRLSAVGKRCNFLNIRELMDAVVDQLENGGTPLVPTGIRALDDKTGGVGIGEMLIVAARPSMGKSLLLRQMAVRAAMNGVGVGFISLEEGDKKIGRNWLASQCQIENQLLRKGNLGKPEWDAIFTGSAQLSDLPIFISEKARRIQDIRALVNIWASKYDVKLIVLDYLQRVRGAGNGKPYEVVSAISGELSDMWKEAGVAAIVAAQLNRGVEGREDKRPNMGDLRDSGAIEQDADGIVFVHREDYYHLGDPNYEKSGIAELIIAKWRDSVRGEIVKLKSNLKYQRFDELDVSQIHPNCPY